MGSPEIHEAPLLVGIIFPEHRRGSPATTPSPVRSTGSCCEAHRKPRAQRCSGRKIEICSDLLRVPDPALATPSIFWRRRLVELGETGLNWKGRMKNTGTVDNAPGR